MPNFLYAQTDLMDMVGRPMSDASILHKAKIYINDAILVLQRMHRYSLTLVNPVLTYNAGEAYVSLESALGGKLRQLESLQLLTSANDEYGIVLKVISYSQLIKARQKYQLRGNPIDYSAEWSVINEGSDHQSYSQSVHRFYGVLKGDELGLYPQPANTTYLRVGAYTWLPRLNLPTDTNFLLDYGYDVVTELAYRSLMKYMKDTTTFLLSTEELNMRIQALETWDNQLSSTN